MSPPPSTPSLVLCGKCLKSVASCYQDICCDICNQFFHRKCFISYSDFLRSPGWTCSACINSTFPFSDVEDNDFFGLFSENQCNDLILADNKKCGTCCKRIKKIFPQTFVMVVLIFFTLNVQLTKILIMSGYAKSAH